MRAADKICQKNIAFVHTSSTITSSIGQNIGTILLIKSFLTDLRLSKTFIMANSASKAEGGSWSGVGGCSKCVGLYREKK